MQPTPLSVLYDPYGRPHFFDPYYNEYLPLKDGRYGLIRIAPKQPTIQKIEQLAPLFVLYDLSGKPLFFDPYYNEYLPLRDGRYALIKLAPQLPTIQKVEQLAPQILSPKPERRAEISFLATYE